MIKLTCTLYIHVHSYTHHLKIFQERDGQILKPPKDKKILVQTTHIDSIHILQIGRIYKCMLYILVVLFVNFVRASKKMS